ncbi:pupal cuticle protein 36a isoform X2 [Topomyia yanbarensis]|uniref:pupal cuticle protein 36a isoform X2 n=1 Tax=Topomyia yanbarensis TaxID=2498891 RepID=UPI00273BAB44|nr:pupal cuticle protein 36a isoform X2 [Topomyia yanbarensis]XP_058814348.1 pupal cuticle protein 36a isoform X2 [Topomyia yanbarensis]
MFTFLMISALVAGASAGYASSQYAGAGTSSGYNGGFASNFVGSGGVGSAAGTGVFTPGFAPYQPVPAYPNVFDFSSFFHGLQSNFANSATQAFATAGATAAASASQYGRYHPHQQNLHYQQRLQQGQGYPYSTNYNNHYNHQNYNGLNSNFDPMNLYQQQIAHQNALFNNIRQQQAAFAAQSAAAGAGAGAGGNFGGAGYAGSSASYGPSGFHQTAQIYPENPNSPNIDTRFGGDTPQGGNGFVGVSSFSSSSNINGQTHREAATTVNDNGKVTSYHVRS